MVQWLRLRVPSAEGPGSIPGRGTRSHMLPLRPRAVKYINILKTSRDIISGLKAHRAFITEEERLNHTLCHQGLKQLVSTHVAHVISLPSFP